MKKDILLSGLVETDEVKKTQKLGAGKYIMEPVTLEKIGLAVKEELEKQLFQTFTSGVSSKCVTDFHTRTLTSGYEYPILKFYLC